MYVCMCCHSRLMIVVAWWYDTCFAFFFFSEVFILGVHMHARTKNMYYYRAVHALLSHSCSLSLSLSMYVCMCLCKYHIRTRIKICKELYKHAYSSLSLYVPMYVPVCMYVCMNVHVYVAYIYLWSCIDAHSKNCFGQSDPMFFSWKNHNKLCTNHI